MSMQRSAVAERASAIDSQRFGSSPRMLLAVRLSTERVDTFEELGVVDLDRLV